MYVCICNRNFPHGSNSVASMAIKSRLMLMYGQALSECLALTKREAQERGARERRIMKEALEVNEGR